MTSTLFTKRTVLIAGTASAFALTLGLVGTAVAQDYPTKPITLIVPYPAGGANDMLGRLIGQKLSERLKQQFVIDNKPGAGGSIGSELARQLARFPVGQLILLDISEYALYQLEQEF